MIVELKGQGGQAVYVNSDHVVAVVREGLVQTALLCGGALVIKTDMTTTEVLAKLGWCPEG